MKLFHYINALSGAILTASGAITAYADTLGAARWASAVIGGLGVVQLISAAYIERLHSQPVIIPPSTTVVA